MIASPGMVAVGGYTVTPTFGCPWGLYLTLTGELLRIYPTRERAIADAERYARLTASLP